MAQEAMSGCCAAYNIYGLKDFTIDVLKQNCRQRVNFVWADPDSKSLDVLKDCSKTFRDMNGMFLGVVTSASLNAVYYKKFADAHKAIQEKDGRALDDIRAGDRVVIKENPTTAVKFRVGTREQYGQLYVEYEYSPNDWSTYAWASKDTLWRTE